MSYAKMMKWNKRHSKGMRQPVLMSTNSGFWPSGAFIKKWAEYAEKCENEGKPYLECQQYYNLQLRN